jgi:hypothetical protein
MPHCRDLITFDNILASMSVFVMATSISSPRILSILSPSFARVSFLFFLACCAAATAAHPLQAAAAPPLPNGPDIQVNASALGGQRNPQVAVFPDGGFVVVWTVQAVAKGRSVLHARSFAADGKPTSGEFLLVDQPGSQSIDAVAADGNILIAAWENTIHAGYAHEVFVGRFERTGAPLGPPVQVNSPSPYSRYGAYLAVDPSGGFAVSWTADATSPYNFLYHTLVDLRRFRSTGAPQGAEILLFEGNAEENEQPVAAGLGIAADGTITAAVDDYTDTDYVLFYEIAPDGEVTAGLVPGGYTDTEMEADFAMAGDGSFAVAWSNFGAIFGRTFNAAATAQEGTYFQIDRGGFDPGLPQVVALPGGAFVAVWTNCLNASYASCPYGIYGRAYAADGVAMTADFPINLATAGVHVATSAAGNGKGDIVVVWQSTAGPAFIAARLLRTPPP